jgi:hypothetical protein
LMRCLKPARPIAAISLASGWPLLASSGDKRLNAAERGGGAALVMGHGGGWDREEATVHPDQPIEVRSTKCRLEHSEMEY